MWVFLLHTCRLRDTGQSCYACWCTYVTPLIVCLTVHAFLKLLNQIARYGSFDERMLCVCAIVQTTVQCLHSLHPQQNSGIRREVGQNLLMPSHRLLMVETAAYLTLWSGAYDVVVVCVHVCVRGGSNVGISRLIPIKTCGLLFSVSLVYCVLLHDFFRPISEPLSHQWGEMPGCCGSWQSSRGGW